MINIIVRSPLQIKRYLSPSLISRLACVPPSHAVGGKCKNGIESYPGRRRHYHVQIAAPVHSDSSSSNEVSGLPRSCPGCGAYAQDVNPQQPGFYSRSRKSVNAFITEIRQQRIGQNAIGPPSFEQTLSTLDSTFLSRIGFIGSGKGAEGLATAPLGFQILTAPAQKGFIPRSTPVCNRCHDLTHHNFGTSIAHPSIHAIRDIVSESPHKYNHIYHVLDAADLPLSLIPSLDQYLSLSPQRSSNRRAKTGQFHHGRKAEVSFIITRSDLLAPKKEQVDALMPQLVKILRDALGRSGDHIRLGNVRCVSSRRGWWTKQIKEDIWSRGGGGWMVGKVNVGKSQLFENVFPKGRVQHPQNDIKGYHIQQSQTFGDGRGHAASNSNDHPIQASRSDRPSSPQSFLDTVGNSLLPPAPMEMAYPTLPLVSSLPGTTASPIRLPFGNGKGELVDLPGLSRGGLEDFVNDHHRSQLVMRDRVKPAQLVIKPGQCLIVGGLVRITPSAPDYTMLAYPFVSLPCHVTSQDKAVTMHRDEGRPERSSIAKAGIADRMQSAGSFSIKWNVTKQRAGPLTRKDAAGLSVEKLPFQIFSLDVLIEGCGWIELVVQVRRRDMEPTSADENFFDNSPYPRIDIVSPDGKGIGIRRPLGAWLLGSNKTKPSSQRTVRPRRSMKGVKKTLKRTNTAAAGRFGSQ